MVDFICLLVWIKPSKSILKKYEVFIFLLMHVKNYEKIKVFNIDAINFVNFDVYGVVYSRRQEVILDITFNKIMEWLFLFAYV